MKRLLSAAWVAPLVAPLFRDAGVLFDTETGQREWGTLAELKHRHPNVQEIELGNAIVLPGLVNAHTHLELSSCSCGDSPTSFVDWILSMPRRIGREVNQRADELFAASTKLGIEQCLRFGVTTVGDISQQMHVTRPILRDSPLSATSFGEVIGLGKRRSRFEELLPLAIDPTTETERLVVGVSPHSPYTLEPGDIRQALQVAAHPYPHLPVAIHVAETPYEREFLRSHSGPLREMWDRLGSWADFPETFDGSPVAFVHACGIRSALLAHVNYCDDADMELIHRSDSTVVYCPRTHRYFGHPPHRWREMLARGLHVAVGTDSCASSPDLNLVDELRLLHEIDPSVPAQTLWRMATINAARAIGCRRSALDFVVFDVSSNEPLSEILETNRLPREVWIAGERVR